MWLIVLGTLPLVGAALTWVTPKRVRQIVGVGFAVATFGLAAYAATISDSLTVAHAWIPQVGAWFALRMDGLSALLVLVSAGVMVVVSIVKLTPDDDTHPLFIPLALALEGFALFTFLADDALLFFLFFEATLLPMYFLIALGGDARRSAAALKFLLYSLAGGLALLGGIIYLMVVGDGLRFEDLTLLGATVLTPEAQQVLLIAFFVAFAVKSPLVPLHPWLPDAVEHGQPFSPVLLVGMLDGMGLYGMVRFCVGVTPFGSGWASAIIEIIAVVTVIYGALAAIASRSLLRLAAFASVSHCGFMVLGLFAINTTAATGAMTYVAAHALSASAFLLAAQWVVQRRGDTLERGVFGGLARRAPVLAGVFLLAGLATLALPGTANFAAEFAVIIGTWARYPIIAAVSLGGVLGAAIYVLWAYQRIFTGAGDDDAELPGNDIGGGQRLAIGLLLVAIIPLGIYPAGTQQMVHPNASAAIQSVQASQGDS